MSKSHFLLWITVIFVSFKSETLCASRGPEEEDVGRTGNKEKARGCHNRESFAYGRGDTREATEGLGFSIPISRSLAPNGKKTEIIRRNGGTQDEKMPFLQAAALSLLISPVASRESMAAGTVRYGTFVYRLGHGCPGGGGERNASLIEHEELSRKRAMARRLLDEAGQRHPFWRQSTPLFDVIRSTDPMSLVDFDRALQDLTKVATETYHDVLLGWGHTLSAHSPQCCSLYFLNAFLGRRKLPCFFAGAMFSIRYIFGYKTPFEKTLFQPVGPSLEGEGLERETQRPIVPALDTIITSQASIYQARPGFLRRLCQALCFWPFRLFWSHWREDSLLAQTSFTLVERIEENIA